MTTLDDSGIRAFLAGLDDVVAEGNDATADLIVDLGQQIAPVDEGDFRDSIQKVDGEDALSKRVIAGGDDAPHGIYVELGDPSNTNYPAQPTLGPAADAIDPGLEVAKRLAALAQRSTV